MKERSLALIVLPEEYAICRLPADTRLPSFPPNGIFSITRTDDEVSLVCQESEIPAGALSETKWRVLMVKGPLDFSLTGVLAALASPLAAAGISIFALSTFLTDYLFVRGRDLASACSVLESAGHRIEFASIT